MSGAAQRRVVVVGASAAGLRCAARLARLEPATAVTVVEARESYSYAACGLPYVLSGDLDDVGALRTTADGSLRDDAYFRDVKGVSVRSGWRAVRVDVASRLLDVRSSGGNGDSLVWDDLVIATGARPRRLPCQPDHPRVVTFHTADDLAPLMRGLTGGSLAHVVVIGAGLVGCELSEAFRTLWGVDVTVVEAASEPLPGVCDPEIGYLVGRAMTNNGVALVAGEGVTAIEADDRRVVVRTVAHKVEADLAVVAVGVEPAAELAGGSGIRLGPTGAIAVNERLATSEPHVWAAGDCVEVIHAVTGDPCHLPLGSLANRQGRTLANVLAGRDDAFPPVAGAVAAKVFDLNVAATGLTRARAERLGLAARSVWTTTHDCAHYWPEAREIALHLVYEEGSRRVLGVQAAGPGEVAKRVDVATQVVARRGTLRDLVHVEHAYAPPYAPALEPLAVAACVAENQEDGVSSHSPTGPLADGGILDVRHSLEQESRPVGSAGVVAAPLESLRDVNLPANDGEWLVVCERGTRAAEAVRILRTRDVAACYLGGGLRWREVADEGGER